MESRIATNLALAAWSLALFALTLFLDTRHADFPFFYHPDEPDKVEQVLHENWNFHHPMLLLSATRAALSIHPVTARDDENAASQQVVELGRFVSAAFIAIAVVALSLLAFLWRGWAPATACGLALALHHQLFELGHYMKEDSALLMGLALAFLAMLALWQTPNRFRSIILGMACGLALSGKYLGIVALAMALPIAWRAPAAGRGTRVALVLAACALAFAIVNWPLLTSPGIFEKSFGREMSLVVHGQGGTTRSVPHAQYWNVFIDNTTPAIWLLLILFLAARWRTRRALTLPDFLLIGFPFAFAIALSFSPKSNDRYFLPATAMFTLLAALGIEDAARLLMGKVSRRAARCIAGGALIACQFASLPEPLEWRTFSEYSRAFQHDDTAELIDYLRSEIPATAVIAKDNRIHLSDPERPSQAARHAPIPQRVAGTLFKNDRDSIDELRVEGVTHVVVSETDYGKYFTGSVRAKSGQSATFRARADFYQQLFREAELLPWERERGTVLYLHPGIRIYRLR